MQVNHLDVKTAFICGEKQDNIYMQQNHPGIEISGNKKLQYYGTLPKSIYGLKQMDRACNEKLKQMFIWKGFEQSKVNPYFYIRFRKK